MARMERIARIIRGIRRIRLIRVLLNCIITLKYYKASFTRRNSGDAILNP